MYPLGSIFHFGKKILLKIFNCIKISQLGKEEPICILKQIFNVRTVLGLQKNYKTSREHLPALTLHHYVLTPYLSSS